MLLLQEFDIEIRDKKGAKNSVVDHLSRIERETKQDYTMVCRHFFHQRHPSYTKRNLRSFTGAFWIPRSNQSSNFVMQYLEVATMDQLRQLRKFLIAGSTGPPFFESPINSSPPTNNVRE
ncbi:hypothetical protein CR513_51348, partial [Mucuna pruriens]